MKEYQNIAKIVLHFLQDVKQKVLLIAGEESSAIHSELEWCWQEVSLRAISFDLKRSEIIEEQLSVLSPVLSYVFIFSGHDEAQGLENVYVKYQLGRWHAKVINICAKSLLHANLDPSIYFAPVKGNRIQKHLLKRVELPALHLQIKPDRTTDKPFLRETSKAAKKVSPSADFLNQKLMTLDPLIMQMLADRVKQSSEFKQHLLELIYATRENQNVQVAAANAITALNYAEVPFSGMDLSDIQVPYADLSEAIFDKANCQRVNFSNCKANDIYLSHADLTLANLERVDFNEIAPVIINFARTQEGIQAGRILDICLSYDAKTLFIICDDAIMLRIYDIDNQCFTQLVEWNKDAYQAIMQRVGDREQAKLTLSTDQCWLAVGLYGTAFICKLYKNNLALNIENDTNNIQLSFGQCWHKIVFLHEKVILIGDGFICICEMQDGRSDILHYEQIPINALTAIQNIPPDKIAIGDDQGFLTIYDVSMQKIIHQRKIGDDKINEINFNESANILAITFNNGGGALYKINTIEPADWNMVLLKGLDQKITRLTFMPGLTNLTIVYTFDCLQKLSLDTFELSVFARIQRPLIAFTTALFPEPYLLAATTTGLIRFYSLRKGKSLSLLRFASDFAGFRWAEQLDKNLEIETCNHSYKFYFRNDFKYTGAYYFIDVICNIDNTISRLLISHEHIRGFAISLDNNTLVTISNGSKVWHLEYTNNHKVKALLQNRSQPCLEACNTIAENCKISYPNEVLLRRYGAKTDFYKKQSKSLFFSSKNEVSKEPTIEEIHDGLRDITTCTII